MGARTMQHLMVLCFLVIAACTEEPGGYFQGYVEGEFLLVASPFSGHLKSLEVRRGTTVTPGQPLFSLESTTEAAALREAQEEALRAESQFADLTKGLRPSEVAALQAQLSQARATEELSAREWKRRQELFANGFISVAELDQAKTALERDRETVARISAELQTAGLGARQDLVEAARAEVQAARARLQRAQWALEQKGQAAPTGALVFDTFFEEGEFVPAEKPVVSLLPPEKVKIRFFVPEPVVGSLWVGEPIAITFDGSRGSIPATVTFISPTAEYTPPVIYSRQTRAKLVFMAEARPSAADAGRFHPGQPVEVHRRGEE